ncbi:unnamed protein product, partial [Prorocentrum cordatum]
SFWLKPASSPVVASSPAHGRSEVWRCRVLKRLVMAPEGSPSGDPGVCLRRSRAQRSAAQRRARAAANRGFAVARQEVEQLNAKVELLQQPRTTDLRAQQAIDVLPPPPERMSSPSGYGRSGRRYWFMRSWMLARRRILADEGARYALLSSSSTFTPRVELTGAASEAADRARHEPLAAESASNAEAAAGSRPVLQALEGGGAGGGARGACRGAAECAQGAWHEVHT